MRERTLDLQTEERSPIRSPLIRNPNRTPQEIPLRSGSAHSRSSVRRERAPVRSPLRRERSSVRRESSSFADWRFRSPRREPVPVRSPLIRERAPSRSPLRRERVPASRSPQVLLRSPRPAQRPPPPLSPRVVESPLLNPNIQRPAQQANVQRVVGEEEPQREEILRGNTRTKRQNDVWGCHTLSFFFRIQMGV